MAWAYFGCFLNVYDPAFLVNGKQVQAWPRHAPPPGRPDRLRHRANPGVRPGHREPGEFRQAVQRNLQVTLSDNPGGAETHRIPQTFDARPCSAASGGTGLAAMPDELMIDWGRVPVGSVAQIYWPQARAATC